MRLSSHDVHPALLCAPSLASRSEKLSADAVRRTGTEPVYEFPPGFRMVAGNPSRGTFNTSDPAQDAVRYACLGVSGPETNGEQRHKTSARLPQPLTISPPSTPEKRAARSRPSLPDPVMPRRPPRRNLLPPLLGRRQRVARRLRARLVRSGPIRPGRSVSRYTPEADHGPVLRVHIRGRLRV